MRSMLGVPLMREGAAIGLLLIFRKRVQPFTKRHVALASTLVQSKAVIAKRNLPSPTKWARRAPNNPPGGEGTGRGGSPGADRRNSLRSASSRPGIAHEIKNPLNFVNNFSALSAELTDELNDVLKPAALDGKTRKEVDELTQTLKDNLEKVVQHGKRADSIVKNMLLHSREGSGEHRPSDINALLDESLNLAYHGARAEKPQFNVTLQRDFDASAGDDRIVSAGNHPRIPEFDLERILCGDQAQSGESAIRVLSRSSVQPREISATRSRSAFAITAPVSRPR